ncbi:MAG: putative PEP-binding protein [Candidatus Woesearchaeota archaeon]
MFFSFNNNSDVEKTFKSLVSLNLSDFSDEDNSLVKKLKIIKDNNISEVLDTSILEKDSFNYYKKNKEFSKSFLKKLEETLDKREFSLVNLSFEEISSIEKRIFLPFLGMNKEVYGRLKEKSNKKTALKVYISFIYKYSTFVFNIDKKEFKKEFKKIEKRNHSSNELFLENILKSFKKLLNQKGLNIPNQSRNQIKKAVKSIFDFWIKEIEQFGEIYNMNELNHDISLNFLNTYFVDEIHSGFFNTRNPNKSANKEPHGIYYSDPFFFLESWFDFSKSQEIKSLKKENKHLYKKFQKISNALEKKFKNILNVNFFIIEDKIYILSLKNAKITSYSKYHFLIELLNKRKITKKEILKRLDPEDLENFSFKTLNLSKENEPIVSVKSSNSISVNGKIVFNKYDVNMFFEEKPLILIKKEIKYEDLNLLKKCKAIIVDKNSVSEKIFSIARKMNDTLLVAVNNLSFSPSDVVLGTELLKKGDWISIDGYHEKIYIGKVELVESKLSNDFKEIIQFTKRFNKISIRSNVRSFDDLRSSREYLSEGVGLLRIDDFFTKQENNLMRNFIFSSNIKERKEILREILPHLRKEIISAFKMMTGKPVSICLFDSSLKKYLPSRDDFEEIEILSKELNLSEKKIIEKINDFQDDELLFGFRGTRFAVVYPEFYGMQIQAIFESVIHLLNNGRKVYPEILLPKISLYSEVNYFRDLVDRIANNMMSDYDTEFKYNFGPMIENTISCLKLEELIEKSNLICFDLDKLCQSFYCANKSISSSYFSEYLKKNLVEDNFFEVIDPEILGFISKNIEKVKQRDSTIKIGVTGEQLNNKITIKRVSDLDIDFISVNPKNVPKANLICSKKFIK